MEQCHLLSRHIYIHLHNTHLEYCNWLGVVHRPDTVYGSCSSHNKEEKHCFLLCIEFNLTSYFRKNFGLGSTYVAGIYCLCECLKYSTHAVSSCQHASNDTVYHVIMKMTSMYTGLYWWAWVSPTPVWLHCVYACLLVCLAWPLMVKFKWVHSHLSWCWNVHTSAQTHENEDVGLYCQTAPSAWKRARAKMICNLNALPAQGNFVINLCYESDDRAWQGRLIIKITANYCIKGKFRELSRISQLCGYSRKFSSVKFRSVASFGAAKASNLWKFSPQNRIFH